MFVAEDGCEIETKVVDAMYAIRAVVGSEVDVYYDPTQPKDAVLADRGSLWYCPLYLSVLGATFLTAWFFQAYSGS